MNLKKVLIAVGIILVGVLVYFAPVLWLINSILLSSLLLIIHIILTILYVNKNYSKKYLKIIIALITIYILFILVVITFNTCNERTGGPPYDSRVGRCDCLGITGPSYFFVQSNWCFGVRTNCYERYIFYRELKTFEQKENNFDSISLSNYAKQFDRKMFEEKYNKFVTDKCEEFFN